MSENMYLRLYHMCVRVRVVYIQLAVYTELVLDTTGTPICLYHVRVARSLSLHT